MVRVFTKNDSEGYIVTVGVDVLLNEKVYTIWLYRSDR